MGKQFQLYLLPSDSDILIKKLRQEVGLHLLARRSARSEPVEVESPVRTEAGFTRADCVLVSEIPPTIKLDHIEKQGYWSINSLFSEVVEFTGCHFDGKTLKLGRFFYDSGFYDDDRWQEKSPRFLDWADKLFKTAKKSLKRIPSLDAYVGADAEHWRSSGGVFVHLAIKGQPPVRAK